MSTKQQFMLEQLKNLKFQHMLKDVIKQLLFFRDNQETGDLFDIMQNFNSDLKELNHSTMANFNEELISSLNARKRKKVISPEPEQPRQSKSCFGNRRFEDKDIFLTKIGSMGRLRNK